MILFKNVCCVSLIIIICVTPILSQEDGTFWWLQKNPQFGGKPLESSGESEEENYIDSDEINDPISRTTLSTGLISVSNGEPSTPRTFQPEEPVVANSPQKGSSNNEERDCVCVDYYLCDANNTVITNGEGIFDFRLGEQCPGVQVCCRLPEGVSKPPVTNQPFKCGEKGGGIITRILNPNGTSTHFSEYPWMLAILKDDVMPSGEVEKNMFQCGASLIHPKVALTAAHCVNVKKEVMKVRAGEWDTRGTYEPIPDQERDVAQIIKHPEFYGGALYNDIALLILEEPFEIVANALPICLPQQDAVYNNRKCVATGWGKSDFRGKYQTTLKEVDLPIIPSDVCQEKLRNTRLGRYFRLHQSFLCAGGESRKDTCKGDGGGPLACYDTTAKGYVQVGIVSWGIGCGDNDIPAVYTNVPRFRNWIDDTLLQLGLS